MQELQPKVFVSHSTTEADVVKELVDSLQTILPDVSFFVSSSLRSLRPGAVWWDEIRGALAGAKIVLACMSRVTAGNLWTLFESGVGLGHGAVVIPVILDDMPASGIPGPLSAFQAVQVDHEGGLVSLAGLIAQATGTEPYYERAHTDHALGYHEGPEGIDCAPGVYAGATRYDITSGWQHYSGDQRTLELCRGYVSIGRSFSDGFRYPPRDSLSAPWRFFGFRIKRQEDVHVYLVLRCVGGSSVKLYASSGVQSWGFSGDPKDEFRVPLLSVPRGKWHVVIISVQSVEPQLGVPIQNAIGLRVRGPLYVSHIWCTDDLATIPEQYRGGASLVSYPSAP